MMSNKIQISIQSILVFLLLISCEKATDFYLGLPWQPDILENTFVDGLNIFALLQPADSAENNKSFVYVQRNWPALEYTDESFTIIKNVDILIIQMENEIVLDTIYFPLMPSDSLFRDTLYRPDQIFSPLPGNTYQIICEYNDTLSAYGETRFPPEPQLVSNSLVISEGRVEFKIDPDEEIKMLDVYVFSEELTGIVGRYVTNDTASIKINLSIPGSGAAYIDIYGYDANLAAYYANSNTSLNFNKYRTTFSTLEQGFGVFGSLNRTQLIVNLP